MSTSFLDAWRMNSPPVMRYLEDEFVADFFRNGSLRLPSFQVFRNNPDEQRGDTREGRVTADIHGPNTHAAVAATVGATAYILCGSLVEDSSVSESFSTENGIVIGNAFQFAQALASVIPGFHSGFEGPCVYRPDPSLRKQMDQPFTAPDADIKAWASEFDHYVSGLGGEALFTKASRFAHQAEYRLIWFSTAKQEPYLYLKCPAAIRLCRPLHFT